MKKLFKTAKLSLKRLKAGFKNKKN